MSLVKGPHSCRLRHTCLSPSLLVSWLLFVSKPLVKPSPSVSSITGRTSQETPWRRASYKSWCSRQGSARISSRKCQSLVTISTSCKRQLGLLCGHYVVVLIVRSLEEFFLMTNRSEK